MAIARAAIAIGNSDDGAWRRSGEHCERDEAVARGWEASWRELRDDIWTRSVRGVRWLFSAPLQHTQGGRRSPPPPWLRVGAGHTPRPYYAYWAASRLRVTGAMRVENTRKTPLAPFGSRNVHQYLYSTLPRRPP
jgi:hypothetical protein